MIASPTRQTPKWPRARRRGPVLLPFLLVGVVEAEPLAVDLLRPSVGRPRRRAPESADEEVHLKTEREEEHDEDGHGVAETTRSEDPREHEPDESDAEPQPARSPSLLHHGDGSGRARPCHRHQADRNRVRRDP